LGPFGGRGVVGLCVVGGGGGGGGVSDLILHGPFGCNEVCALVMLWLFWPIPIIQTHTFCRSLQLLSFGK